MVNVATFLSRHTMPHTHTHTDSTTQGRCTRSDRIWLAQHEMVDHNEGKKKTSGDKCAGIALGSTAALGSLPLLHPSQDLLLEFRGRLDILQL